MPETSIAALVNLYLPPTTLARLLKYSPDQDRDERGRFGSGGGASTAGIKLQQTTARAWQGKQETVTSSMSRQEAGALGEAIAMAHLQGQGYADAHLLNTEHSNFPVDGIADHAVYEVKTGLASNSRSAQQWRATIGQPGKAETEWLKTASAKDKAAWNESKQQAIIDRKEAALAKISADAGRPVAGRTMTMIINPDKKVVDLYQFDGFHSRIGWSTASAGYVKSYRYG